MPHRFEARAEGGPGLPEHGDGDPFAAVVRGTHMPVLITDPRLPDHPIVFANDAFLALTGYEHHEVIGRNCRFLQGPGTDPACVAEIRQAIREERAQFQGDILNYRRDGTPFWNALFLSPVRDETGRVVYFFASQTDVTERKKLELREHQRAEELEAEVARRTAELQRTVAELQSAVAIQTDLLHEVDHRVKNNLQVIAALVQLQARHTTDEEAQRGLRSVAQRIEALSTVHRRLYQGADVARFDIAEFARDLATGLVTGSGREDIALELDLQPVEIGRDKAAPLALLVNEILTNAVRHAFRERGGRLVVRVRPQASHGLIEILDDGVGMPGQELSAGSFGRKVADVLARQLQATVEWSVGEPGTKVTVELPLSFTEEAGP